MDDPVLLTGATATSAAVFFDISKGPAVWCGALESRTGPGNPINDGSRPG